MKYKQKEEKEEIVSVCFVGRMWLEEKERFDDMFALFLKSVEGYENGMKFFVLI